MKYNGLELLKHLSLAFGPTSREDVVRNLIVEQIEGECDGYCEDRVGNLIAKVSGRGLDYHPENPQRLMLAAHMDEVGFMIREITTEGYLKFGLLGGMDPRVLCGRTVTIYGKDDKIIRGTIASKAIHMQTLEERSKITPVEKMYIDIGAMDKEDAEAYVSVGDCATFASDFVTFGEDEKCIKGKALDDRAGCAALIEIMRALHASSCDLPFDVYFAFTRCEEIGISGAVVVANTVAPDYAIIMEATAINDLPGVSGPARVSSLGGGVVVSLVDAGTIYDPSFVRYALQTGEDRGIKCQIKQFASGANDARVIQRSLSGVRVLGLALPTRYIHSASNVTTFEDYESARDLTIAMLKEWKLN